VKRFSAILIFFLLFALPALALVPKPYIGASIQSNSPTGDFAGEDLASKEGGAKSGMGGEVDLGISGGMASAYIGYRFGKFDASSSATIPGVGEVKATGEWEVNRWVIGARWHLLGSLPTPIFPTLGGGVTIGKTTAGVGGSTGGETLSIKEDSKSSVGWFLEGGAVVRLIGNMSLIGDVQYHRFDADYSSDLYDGKIKVSFFTLQLGARLALM
jgi:hypothetical protein